MRDWQLSLSGVQECSELRRIIIYNLFFFHIWWMKFNRFDGHAWPFLGDMILLEVKSSDWTLCTKKSEFLRKIYMDFFLQLNYSLWSKLSYLNSKVRIYGKYWLPMTICWTWLDLENYNFIGIIVWWMILIS